MQVSVENTSTLGRRITVSVPKNEVTSIMQEKMAALSGKARVAGFRQGKIPKSLLEQRFGPQVRQEAVGIIIDKSLPEALAKNALRPAEKPTVEYIVNEDNKDLEYVVNFEIFPEFSLADYSEIKVEKPVAEISDKDVDAALEKLKIQHADWIVVDRPAKLGDRLTIDYQSTQNGKTYENSSGQDVLVELGSRLFIEGFEEGLLGTRQGDEKNLNLEFPKDWRIEKLAGKPVDFTVKVKVVAEKSPAEMNEAFAKKLGLASGSVSEMREKIRDNLTKQVAELSMSRLKDQITDALLKLNRFPLPQALIEREMTALHEDLHRRMGDQPQTACQHHGLSEQAERRVALGLILNEVIRIENLKPDQEQVRKRISALAKMFGNAEFLESMYYESQELMSGVQHTVLLDQAMDVVIGKSTIVEKKVSVESLLNKDVK